MWCLTIFLYFLLLLHIIILSFLFCSIQLRSLVLDGLASYADALWARHAFFPHEHRLRDEPKERLRRRLWKGHPA